MSTPTPGQIPEIVAIRIEGDIVVARRAIRDAAASLGFSQSDVTRIVTAASELARNIYRYAGTGTMQWSRLDGENRTGIELKFIDQGPGIKDIALALHEGYSTGGGLGMGLSGAKRLADEMEIESTANKGTTVTLRKWRRN
jgi:serine/threonine-protein kinase RsbT